ncbi:hypothetical protein AT246_06190 [Bartonella henselae]|nr:hypothetical protein AT246_06190 [Bartonella henselae]
MNEARLDDLKNRPETYKHIWEGAYLTAVQGAYYQKEMLAAEQEGRIGRVACDPLMQMRAFWDIGGTGAKAGFKQVFSFKEPLSLSFKGILFSKVFLLSCVILLTLENGEDH